MSVLFLCLLLLCLFTLPLAGTWLSGHSVLDFLAFPPRTRERIHGEVSWAVFMTSLLCIMVVMIPFIQRLLTFRPKPKNQSKPQPFSLWGWLSAGCLLFFWTLAWHRFEWVGEFQLHTFTPLWLSYIALMNALTYMRTQRCLLSNRPGQFFSLFPLSAMYWWVFEYLNRFAQNWYYIPAIEVDGLTYFLIGSLSFSTVLPAIYCTYEWLLSIPWLREPFKSWKSLHLRNQEAWRWSFFAVACLGLIGIGLWPTRFYPLIWVSPLLLLFVLQKAQKREALLKEIEQGDWRSVVIPAMAGFLCGVLWELWNAQSLAHWKYTIPYLQTFHIFEMPMLGYAGYLPFGLSCVMCVQLLLPSRSSKFSQERVREKTSASLKMTWQTPWHRTRNI